MHLAHKAFYPAKPPFALLHVDTGWKFREMIAFRDRRVDELGLELIVHVANFTGIDSPYEAPEAPDLHLHTTAMSLEQEIETLMKALRNRGVID